MEFSRQGMHAFSNKLATKHLRQVIYQEMATKPCSDSKVLLDSSLDRKEISPGCSLEGMMLQLKLQYFGHLMRRVDSLEKTLMLVGDWGQEEKGTAEDEMAGWHH